jgi:hypothetical protein
MAHQLRTLPHIRLNSHNSRTARHRLIHQLLVALSKHTVSHRIPVERRNRVTVSQVMAQAQPLALLLHLPAVLNRPMASQRMALVLLVQHLVNSHHMLVERLNNHTVKHLTGLIQPLPVPVSASSNNTLRGLTLHLRQTSHMAKLHLAPVHHQATVARHHLTNTSRLLRDNSRVSLLMVAHHRADSKVAKAPMSFTANKEANNQAEASQVPTMLHHHLLLQVDIPDSKDMVPNNTVCKEDILDNSSTEVTDRDSSSRRKEEHHIAAMEAVLLHRHPHGDEQQRVGQR